MQAGADRKHCTQVLWLFGEDMQVSICVVGNIRNCILTSYKSPNNLLQMTELGTMNLFVYWTNEKGGMHDV